MSSPRQKMVIVTAPQQPNELDQKKKRQTLERAKANHLSRQLQMRLRYAKLKVEHGWQRQNLNEVENLYFHHSHQRNMRQGTGAGVGQRMHYAPVPAETQVGQSQAPTPFGVPDRTVGPSPASNDPSPLGSVSPPLQSPSGQPTPLTTAKTPVPVAPATSRPQSALDLSDPNLLARLAQLQSQVELSSQLQLQIQVQAVSRHPSTTITPTSISTSAPASQLVSVPGPIPGPNAFAPHVPFSQPLMGHPQPSFALLGTPAPGSAPIYPVPTSAPQNHQVQATSFQPPIPSPVPVGPTTPIPATPIPTQAPIAPSALTYDSFWSTHASSTGSTRALYRTHTGFTASAAPGGNVAMLTPGGHAAVMTAEGVYVGGNGK